MIIQGLPQKILRRKMRETGNEKGIAYKSNGPHFGGMYDNRDISVDAGNMQNCGYIISDWKERVGIVHSIKH